MRGFINSFMSNESAFGRVMNKVYIIICANLMFVLCSLPIVTIGASYAGLYHVMLKTLRGDGMISPFKQFLIGFKNNFKQATIVWIAFVALLIFGWYDVWLCQQAGEPISFLRYGIYAMGILLVIVFIYIMPSIAAFEGNIRSHIRNAIYFAFHKPWWILVNVFFHVFPLYLTYSDPQFMPLYAFCWFFFGFGALCMMTSRLLIKDFNRFLPLVDDFGDFILDEDGNKILPGSEAEKRYREENDSASGGYDKTEDEILEEMKKLDM